MELYRPRGSSIPRNYRQIPPEDRFSVADAAQLKLTLHALDDKIGRNADIQTLKDACQARPFHEEIYVDGSEEFFLLVKSITRADLIPMVYIEALDTLRQGRFPINHHRYTDFKKGIDPTFSEVRALLGRIDGLCGTKLDASICALENEGRCSPAERSFLAYRVLVTPFPFLRLPAELRLQIYAHHLPREDHIALLHDPFRKWAGKSRHPHVDLAVMRTNQQLHDEIAKYFYGQRTLFMQLARDKNGQLLSDEFISRYYETLAVMNPSTRGFFTKIELQIGLLPDQHFEARRYQHVKSVSDPMRHMLALLPNLSTFVVTFARRVSRPLSSRIRYAEHMRDTLQWLLTYIPDDAEILWDFRSNPHWFSDESVKEEMEVQKVIESRGPMKHTTSVTTHFWPVFQ